MSDKATIRRSIKKKPLEIDIYNRDAYDSSTWNLIAYQLLISASENGNLNKVKMILDKGPNPRYWTDRALVKAAKNGHTRIVEELLKAGADPQTNGNELLNDAIKYRYLEIIKILLNAGVNINNSNIITVVRKGDLEIVEIFLRHGSNPPRLGFYLTIAIRSNEIEMVNLLLQYGAKPDDDDFQTAVDEGYPEILRILLDHGVELTDHALVDAAKNEYPDIVKILTQIDYYPQSEYDAALYEAAKNGDIETVEILLNAGAGFDMVLDFTGRGTFALEAAASNKHLDVVEILLDAGADPNQLSKFRRPVKDNEIRNFIENYERVDPDLIIEDGFTHLITAAYHGPRHLLREYLSRSKNIDYRDPEGKTALIYAIESGDPSRVREMLRAGADPMIDDINGRTTISYAVLTGNREIIDELMKTDPNLLSKDVEGISAYQLLLDSEDPELRRLGQDIFVASTQSELVREQPGTYYTKQMLKKHDQGGPLSTLVGIEPLSEYSYQEYMDECAKEGNVDKVLQLADILGISKDKVVGKSQEEICQMIKRMIRVLRN